jgi:hypothetical protein
MQASSERLPWLADEPLKAARQAASPRPAPSARAMWPWYLLLLLLVSGVAAGLWWLGTEQQEAPPPELAAEQSIPIPVTRPAPAAPAEPLANAAAAAEAEAAAEPPPLPARRRVQRRAEAPPSSASPRSAPPAERSQSATPSRGVFPADEPVAAPPQTGPRPIVVYHPQPNRGRVIQLGAFPTRAQAEQSWRRVVRRYPYLATKPKMVNTVDVRGLGGGRPTRMYRLQLGTSSQAQSAVICQQLERAGQSCVVVY